MKGFKMSYSNGLLSESTSQGEKDGKDGKDGLPGVGFKLTSSGDFDLQGKRLTNVADGTADDNAVTKKQIATKVDKVMTDDLDANSKKIKNVSQGTDADAFPLSHGKSLFLTINNSKFDAKKSADNKFGHKHCGQDKCGKCFRNESCHCKLFFFPGNDHKKY